MRKSFYEDKLNVEIFRDKKDMGRIENGFNFSMETEESIRLGKLRIGPFKTGK